MNYQEAKNILDNKRGNKDIKKLANNTYLHRHADHFAIRLHETDIISFYPSYFVLNNGGWYTMTTKARMNEYVPVLVTQDKSIWYIGSYLYTNGMKIKYDGTIINPVTPEKTIKAVKGMKKRIKTYADNFIKQNYKKAPSAGDCWFCCMRTVDNMSLSDVSMNKEHLLSHMSERYYVPSLMVNALNEAGHQDAGMIVSMGIEDMIQRSIVKYMQRRLLPR